MDGFPRDIAQALTFEEQVVMLYSGLISCVCTLLQCFSTLVLREPPSLHVLDVSQLQHT